MKGIILKHAVKMFGLKDGFGFWFRWSFRDPAKVFYWKYIIGKPFCTHHSYFLCEDKCNHRKIYGRRNIIKYTKMLADEAEVESKTIKGYDDGICTSCGEEKGTEIINDPNLDTLERWLVCKTCKEVIELEIELAFPLISIERKQQISNRLLQISKETGKSIFIAEISRDKKVTNIEYKAKNEKQKSQENMSEP